MEISADPVIIVDGFGKISDANRAALQITGKDINTLVNTSFSSLFIENENSETMLSALFESGEATQLQLTLNNNSRTELHLTGTSYPVSEGAREAVIILRDVTPQKKAEEQTAHLAAIVTSSNDAIISKSINGTISVWNKSAEKIFAYSSEEVIGKNISILIPQGLEDEEESLMEKVKNGEVIEQHETKRKRKDGKLINVSFSVSPIRDTGGKITGISEIVREITEQKRFEQELIEAKRNAEREKKLAEQAMDAKQQFLSNMSHEIRTPLNAIIGFTKVVLKTNLDEKQKEYLNAIKVSGDALIVLINDILDLAKVEAGKMTFEEIPFKLKDSISSMLHLFETKLVKKKIDLVKHYDSSIPEVLLGDPIRLHQIILNLVSNAIKFTSQGKITFSVKLKHETTNAATLEFIIEDTGIGIAEDKLDSIFNNFQQASQGTTRLYGGTGLGLAIVKQLVLAQEGSLQVKSKVNEGSVFSFSLSFKKTEQKVENKVEPQIKIEEKSEHVRILVAEDVTLNQLLIKTLLKEFGFEAVIAGNGKIAIEKLESQNFDLILMDLQMPEMNGYEATKHIRETLKSQIPIIALTADVTTADVEKCRSYGMNDYVSKPIDDKLLYTKILKYVDKAAALKRFSAKKEAEKKEEKNQVINLEYLKQHTKENPQMMKEMIKIYLEETPRLIDTMRQSIDNMDWESLGKAAHSVIPTFSIIGINEEYAEMAKKIKEHALKKEEAPLIATLLVKIDEICSQAIKELEAELDLL